MWEAQSQHKQFQTEQPAQCSAGSFIQALTHLKWQVYWASLSKKYNLEIITTHPLSSLKIYRGDSTSKPKTTLKKK